LETLINLIIYRQLIREELIQKKELKFHLH
jgi:hypothetical protein